MSANTTPLRRILRSIGSHATPSSTNPRASSTPNPRRRPISAHTASQPLGPTSYCHDVAQPQHRRGYSTAKPGTNNDGDSVWKPTLHDEPATSHASSIGEGNDRRSKDSAPLVRRTLSSRQLRSKEQDENMHMKKRARKHQLLKDRHEHGEERALQEILQVLERDSPRGAKHYTKRMETIRLPEGIYAKWTRDPNESILEIMQRTGSHAQVIPGTQVGHFSSLTLWGTSPENASAKRLLQTSDLLQAVSEDDVNASKSLADYDLQFDDPEEYEKVDSPKDQDLDDIDLSQLQKVVEDVTMTAPVRAVWSSHPEEHEKVDSPKDQDLDDIDLSQLQKVVEAEDVTTNTPVRAVWSRRPEILEDPKFQKTALPDGRFTIETPSSYLPLSTVTLTARVEELTIITKVPRQVLRKTFGATDPVQPISAELVSILTKPEHSEFISQKALATAIAYLAEHMCFPAAREILDSFDNDKFRLTTDAFNPLLMAAATSENVLAFHYVVHTMTKRGVRPNMATWLHFQTLMQKRFPAKDEQILTKMKKRTVAANPAAMIENYEDYIVPLLASWMDTYPGAPIKDFVENIQRDVPDLKWFTTYAANRMCHKLITVGETNMALQVVDELVRYGGRPNTITLNTFLSAARAAGNMEMAVAILNKLRNLRTEAASLSDDTAGQNTLLPSGHDLGVTLNQHSFKQLYSLAWDRKYFNTFRVIWRFVCCAGHVDRDLLVKMKPSFRSRDTSREYILAHNEGGFGPRHRLWEAWGARFAIGVRSGLTFPAPTVASATTSDEANASGVSEINLEYLLKNERCGSLLGRDIRQAGVHRPTAPFVELVEEAYLKDREWKSKLLGTAKGLAEDKWGEGMFEAMLKDGIKVEMEEGAAGSVKV